MSHDVIDRSHALTYAYGMWTYYHAHGNAERTDYWSRRIAAMEGRP